MSSISSQIEKDFIESYKSKDFSKIAVLRMLKNAIKNAQIDKNKDLTDQDIFKIISKEIKQRRESAEQYIAGSRQDLADKELEEIKYIEIYLPKQLNDDELTKIIRDTILKSGSNKISDFGKIMSLLMPKVIGIADGKKVSIILKQILSE